MLTGAIRGIVFNSPQSGAPWDTPPRVPASVQLPIIWAIELRPFRCRYVGFAQYYRALVEDFSTLELAYCAIQLYVPQSGALDHSVPPALDIARFLAPAVFGYTATRALMSMLREQFLTLQTAAAQRRQLTIISI